MFDKNTFCTWWTPANLANVNFGQFVTYDPAEVKVEAWSKRSNGSCCYGLLVGGIPAHITITAQKGSDEFELFHLTLDSPYSEGFVTKPKEKKSKKKEKKTSGEATGRCDHVFFEVDDIGDVKVSTSMFDPDGKATNAKSQSTLAHNMPHLVSKVQTPMDQLMTTFASQCTDMGWH